MTPGGEYAPLPTSDSSGLESTVVPSVARPAHHWESDVDEIDKVDDFSVPGEDELNPFVLALVGTASVSGLLFGYDTGIISGTLVTIGRDLGAELSTWQKEAITAATTLGALCGGLGAGGGSGRRRVLAVANVVFIAGALIQAAAHSVRVMVVGRFVVGLGVGLASCIAPMYIGELAPTRLRGRLVTLNAVACTLGQVVAYGIGAVFARAPAGWRWMVGLGALPAMVQLASLAFLPESPRILLVRGDTAAVSAVFSRIYPLATFDDLARKIAAMRDALRHSAQIEAETTWRERAESLFRVGGYRRALIIGCGLQALQQLCGFNSLMYFSASIFAALGFDNPTATGMLIALANFAFTLVALKIVDPLGRRTVMLYTVPPMAASLLLVSVAFHYLTIPTGGVLIPGTDYPKRQTLTILGGMILYVASYATGLGNIPWQQGELFPLEVRALGSSVATATNWTCNLVVAATFLSLMERASPAGAFALYAAVCGAGWVFCYYLYPETSGLSLEEVGEVFKHDFGVQKSREMRAAKMAVEDELHRRMA